MKKFFMVLPLMVALVALVGCKSKSSVDVSDEDLKENDPYYESFNIVDFGIFGQPELIPGTEQQFQIEAGTVDAQLGYFQFIAWGNGINYNESNGQFSGKGFMIQSIVPVYTIIAPAEYAGGYFVPEGGFRIGNTSTPAAGVMPAGKIDPATYGDWIAYLNDESKTYDSVKVWSKTNGTLFCLDDYNDQENYPESYVSLYRGQINKLVINLDANGNFSTWGADVTWSNTTSDIRWYGFKIDPETNALVRPYDFKTVNRTFNGEVLNAAANAPARAPRAICKPFMLKK